MVGMFPDTPEYIEMKDRPKDRTETGKFETIPALSVKRGLAVKPLTDGFNEFNIGIEDAVETLISKYPKLLLVDYDGLISNKPKLDLIQDIQKFASDSDIDLELWVEAGVRFSDGAIDIFVAGANSVVICSSLIASYRELKKATAMSGDIILSIDLNGDKVVSPSKVIRGKNPEDLITEGKEMGIGKFIIDEVVTDDSKTSPAVDFSRIKKLLETALKNDPSACIYIHSGSKEIDNRKEKLQDCGLRGIILDISESDLTKDGK